MSHKMLHISPDEFVKKSFMLGRKIYEAGFRPKHTISVWRGGTPVGLGVDGFFRTRGIFMNHTTIATESYKGIDNRGEVIIKGLEHVINVVCREDDLLILDDVYESGNTIKAIYEALKSAARANTPKNIMVGTIHNKPSKHEFYDLKHISVEDIEGDVWIDYPHELADLVSPDDPEDSLIKAKNPEIWDLLHNYKPERMEYNTGGKRRYVTGSELNRDSVKLGLLMARKEKFEPDFLIALWPGGVNSGLPIHEVYKYLKVKGEISKTPDHISLNTTRTHLTYKSNIIGLNYLIENINKHHKVLIIDTAFRSGRLISDVVTKLKEELRRNLTLDNIKVATVYYNPSDDATWTARPFVTEPDFYLAKVDHTMIYPQNLYRLADLPGDLKTKMPDLYKIIYG